MSGSPEDALLGRIAIHYKLITADQLAKALAHQQATNPRMRIGEAHSTLETGVLSYANPLALATGLASGMACRDALAVFGRRG